MKTSIILYKNLSLINCCRYIILSGFLLLFTSSSYAQVKPDDIRGTYKLKEMNEFVAMFRIYTSADGVFVDKHPADASDFKSYNSIVESEWHQKLVGLYKWNSTEKKFINNHNKIKSFNPYQLGLNPEDKSGSLYMFVKEQNSLSNLAGSKGKDLSHLLGTWNIKSASRLLKLYTSSKDELIVHDVRANDFYDLNRTESAIEKYEGFSRNSGEGLLITVLSNNEIKLDLGGNVLKAQRIIPYGQSKMVAKGRKSGIAAINEKDASGRTKLHQAVYNGSFDDVEELLKLGADVHTQSNSGKSALHDAVIKEDLNMVNLLLDHKANVNAEDKSKKSPFDLAIANWKPSNTSILDAFLEKKPVISRKHLDQAFSKNEEKEELIIALIKGGASANYSAEKAVQKNDLQLFQTVVENAPDKVKITDRMFDQAVDSKNYMMADILISEGANPNHVLKKVISLDISELVYSVAAVLPRGEDRGAILEYAVKKKDTELATIALKDHNADASKQFVNAAKSNHQPMVELLLEEGKASPTSGLYPAVDNKNNAMLIYLLEKGADSNYAIAYAAGLGHDELVKTMIRFNGDPSKGLAVAANNGHSNTVNILLDAGADANLLMPVAIEKGNTDWVQLSLEKGAKGDTPAFINTASGKGNTEIVKLLLTAGASPDDGLVSAAKNDHTNTVKFLLEEGANPNPLMPIAIEKGKTDWVRLSLENGAKGNKSSYISKASEKGYSEIVRLLLKADADPEDGILSATKNDHSKTVKILLDAGADPQPIMPIAIRKKKADWVKWCLENGAEGDKTEYIETACKNSDLAIVSHLLDAGADPNAVISVAVNANASTVLQKLIDAGGDANQPALLMHAVKKSFSPTVAVLLDQGLDANTLIDDNSGRYFIHYAAQYTDIRMLKVLVSKGANMDIPTENGKANTALHLLAAQGKKALDSAKVLVEAGADVNAKNAEGKLILKVAKSMKMKKMLKKNGAKKK